MGIIETIIEIVLLIFFVNMAYYWGKREKKERLIKLLSEAYLKGVDDTIQALKTELNKQKK